MISLEHLKVLSKSLKRQNQFSLDLIEKRFSLGVAINFGLIGMKRNYLYQYSVDCSYSYHTYHGRAKVSNIRWAQTWWDSKYWVGRTINLLLVVQIIGLVHALVSPFVPTSLHIWLKTLIIFLQALGYKVRISNLIGGIL